MTSKPINSFLIEPFKRYNQFAFSLSTNQSLLKLVLKIGAIAVIPVSYPILGMTYLIGRIILWIDPFTFTTYLDEDVSTFVLKDEIDGYYENIPPFELGNKIKEKIDNLSLSGNVDWREQAVRLIRHTRLDDPQAELERLKGAGVLDLETEIKLDEALKKVIQSKKKFTEIDVSLESSLKSKVTYAQAIEIKKIYQDDYYVFVHAQSSNWTAFIYCIKELWKINYPETNSHQFKFLRLLDEEQTSQLESIKHEIKSKKNNDNNIEIKRSLLSVDAFFSNFTAFESALYFLTSNSNMHYDVFSTIKASIKHFYPNFPTSSFLTFYLKIQHVLNKTQFLCGNLFLICIPKNQKNLYYRSHEYGKPCQCHPESKNDEILEKLQTNIIDDTAKCLNRPYPIPQYRMYLPDIQPEKGQKVFFLNSSPKVQRKELKKSIRGMIAIIHQLYSQTA